MSLKKILLILPILIANTSYAQSSINKQNFISQFKQTFPPLVCNPNHVFMKCFKVSGAQCNTETNIAMKSCIKREDKNIPATVTMGDINRLGETLGECIGNQYGTKFAHLFIQGCE